MIELRTGTPGAGKTLLAIAAVKKWSEKDSRPVFYSGITITDAVALPWSEIDAEKWFEAPPNSIILIDECQRLFRPRGNGAQVPKYVSELETHRHNGLDLVLITQHPMLVDSNVRRLVGRHLHVSRRFGMQRASVFEYESCKDQPLSKIDSATARHEISYPKEVFSWYKSAEVHTVKRRLPAKFFLIAGSILAAIGGAWWVWDSFQKKLHPDPVASSAPAPEYRAAPGRGRLDAPVDPLRWYKDRAPRVAGFAYTAPFYDEVTKPVTAPYPAVCISSKTKCLCHSQQSTRLDVPDAICRQIASNGFFKDWQPSATNQQGGSPQVDQPSKGRVSDTPAAVEPPVDHQYISVPDGSGPALSPIS